MEPLLHSSFKMHIRCSYILFTYDSKITFCLNGESVRIGDIYRLTNFAIEAYGLQDIPFSVRVADKSFEKNKKSLFPQLAFTRFCSNMISSDKSFLALGKGSIVINILASD